MFDRNTFLHTSRNGCKILIMKEYKDLEQGEIKGIQVVCHTTNNVDRVAGLCNSCAFSDIKIDCTDIICYPDESSDGMYRYFTEKIKE